MKEIGRYDGKQVFVGNIKAIRFHGETPSKVYEVGMTYFGHKIIQIIDYYDNLYLVNEFGQVWKSFSKSMCEVYYYEVEYRYKWQEI